MSNEFWTSTGRYGVICQAERASRAQSPGCLVVFVHGLFGDCQRTWARMPEWVIERSGVKVDVASFSYPAQIWQRTSISQVPSSPSRLAQLSRSRTGRMKEWQACLETGCPYRFRFWSRKDV